MRLVVLYFYEGFLKVFEEGLWKRFGVIYTPVAVVEYQVAAVQRALVHRSKQKIHPSLVAHAMLPRFQPCRGADGVNLLNASVH